MSEQDQADIGAEINERELYDQDRDLLAGYVKPDTEHVPTPSELVSELLTQCTWYIDDLAQVDNVALLVDLPRDELAPAIRDLDKILQLVGVVRDECAQALANLMESDVEAIAGLAVERSQSIKTEWDRDGSWRAVRATIVDRWARDGVAFDSGKAELIDRTLADVKTAHNAMTPSVTGLKALDINPNEWRATTRNERWSVRVK